MVSAAVIAIRMYGTYTQTSQGYGYARTCIGGVECGNIWVGGYPRTSISPDGELWSLTYICDYYSTTTHPDF